MSAASFTRSQFLKLPYPAHDFAGQTIIVTGSNTGMGLEAARHFVRLSAAKVILAVRDRTRGEAAKASIDASTAKPSVVEVWDLDLASYDSVLKFVKRASGLVRLDVAVLNAAINTLNFEMSEEDEKTITVNVISTLLLGMGLLPILRKTSVEHTKEVVLTFTGSFVHFLTEFPERKEKMIFEGLKDGGTARMNDRYNVSKMIELLCVRELATQLSDSQQGGDIVCSIINPGFVHTDIMRERGLAYNLWFKPVRGLFSRTAEVGSRTLLHASEGGRETHGQYLSDCEVTRPSDFVRSEEGLETQKRLWNELREKLEKIQPGIMQNV